MRMNTHRHTHQKAHHSWPTKCWQSTISIWKLCRPENASVINFYYPSFDKSIFKSKMFKVRFLKDQNESRHRPIISTLWNWGSSISKWEVAWARDCLRELHRHKLRSPHHTPKKTSTVTLSKTLKLSDFVIFYSKSKTEAKVSTIHTE